MSDCLVGLTDLVCIPYLDNVLCHGKTFDEHLGNLSMVLRRLKQHGVKLRAGKCLFLKNEVKHLGKIISKEEYSDNNPLFYVMTSSKLNASGMPRISELSNYNISIECRPGKVSVDCDYLYRTPVKSFENHTKETNFFSVLAITNALSTSSDSWLTVLPSTLNILDNLNIGNDDSQVQ